jgi:serine/tyrosine/threonine adenylyltransferase
MKIGKKNSMDSKGVIMTNTGWNFNNSYKNLPESFYTSQNVNPVSSPKLVVLNESLAESLGLNAQKLQSEENISVFAGNAVPEGASPLAQAYAGHQFGHFTMLGDGRALLIGEQITPDGDRFDIQLKGSGRTRYSRGGDGRAALGPMLREYIISEAMHALGIPTTRSLAVVATGEEIIRETMLPGAILTRVAASHIRVGTFEYALRFTSIHELRALADYTIGRHYPEIELDEGRYLALLKEVIKRQAKLISQWHLVGFIHGVMNTDNMTISGETIDYGPCAFMDAYDRATVFSSIDREGRYAYGNQPYIGLWNLTRFAESLLPLLHDDEERAVKLAEEALATFKDLYQGAWLAGMRAKLGLFTEEEEDESLITDLLALMESNRVDYTNTFRALTFGQLGKLELAGVPEFGDWHEKWHARLGRQPQSKEEVNKLMRISNPAVIPRNHRVEEALEAAVEGDFTVMKRLLDVLSKPYAHTPEQEEYTTLPDQSCGPYRTYCGT